MQKYIINLDEFFIHNHTKIDAILKKQEKRFRKEEMENAKLEEEEEEQKIKKMMDEEKEKETMDEKNKVMELKIDNGAGNEENSKNIYILI